MAKLFGANFCHIRPADLERKDLSLEEKNLEVARVKEIFEMCHELETPDFGVFTVTHKFNDNFKVQHKFKKCLASPLVLQKCCDKRDYICVDHRMDARYEVKEWGSKQHLDLINSIVPDRDCSRCTWGTYNEICEKVVMNDSMHLAFP
jgi:hypothetical protein